MTEVIKIGAIFNMNRKTKLKKLCSIILKAVILWWSNQSPRKH